MRHFSPMVLLLALSSLTGCASSFATRSHDTAVRAEPRRVSAASVEEVTSPFAITPEATVRRAY